MNQPSRTVYAIGTFLDSTPVLAVFSSRAPSPGARRGGGWRCRSTDVSRMQCDYVSDETVHDVCRWIDLDLKHPYHLTMNREEAVEYLATHWSSVVERPGWMAPDPSLEKGAAVERVLRHLECGW